jgi:hypothetical protein
MGAAADAARKRYSGGGTAARAARAGSGGGGTTSSGYQHPTGGAKKGRNFLAEQAPKVKPTGVWTPIQAVFDWASSPSYAIGSAIQGRPLESLKNTLNFIQPGTRGSAALSGAKVYPSQALRGHGLLPGGTLGAGLGLVIDIATDPLTYLTFGAGAAPKAAVTAATRQASMRIAAMDRLLTPAEIARVAAPVARAEADAPARIGVGFRVPFTRGKVVPIASSEKVPAWFAKQGERAPARLQDSTSEMAKFFAADRGASKAVSVVHQAARRNAEVWRRKFARDARRLDIEMDQIGKGLGLKPGEAGKQVAFAIDNPDKYLPTLPAELAEPMARAQAMLGELNRLEIAAKIEKGQRPNYLPHVLANRSRKDREGLDRAFGKNAGALDNPFFVKARATNNLDEFLEAGTKYGFTPELNVSKIIERRAAASFKAQEKKAIDDAIFNMYGKKPPKVERVDVETPALALEQEQIRLERLMSREGGKPEAEAASMARQRLTEAHAAVRAAQRTRDPELVREARGRLEAARAEVQAPVPITAADEVADAGEVEKAIRRAKQAVTRQEKRLAKAQRQKSKPAIRDAEAALRRARANERRAAIALNVKRAQYGGAPRNIVAQVKRVQKQQAKLAKAEREAGAVVAANKRLAERPGQFAATKEEYELAKETWREIKNATKYHEGTLLPDEIAKGLDRVHDAISATIKDEDGLAAVGKFMANLGARWKALALLSPGYHIRNQIDDGWRAWMAGARDPLTYARAARIVPHPERLVGMAADTVEPGGPLFKFGKERLTRKEILDRVESMGGINTGFVPSEIGSSMDTVARRAVQGPGRGPFVRASSEWGQYRENVMRLFVVMERVNAGDDLFTAVGKANEYLFDYGQVGKFVEVARRFWVPFITFPSKAIPFTLKQAATRPGLLANISKGISASNYAAGDPDLSQLPPWLRSGFAIPEIGPLRKIIQAPEDQPLILNPERVSSWASLNLLDPRPKQAWSNVVGGMVNPLATTPAEIITGFDNFFVRPGSPVTKQGPLIRWLHEQGLPLPGVADKTDAYTGATVPGYATWLDKTLSLLPVFGQASGALPGGSTETPRLGPFKYATGLPITPYDRAKAAFFADRYGR